MSIVFLSIIGIALEEIQGQVFPINPTIIRVMRVLRIARVLKLLKMAKGIRALLDTVMQALPQVGNLGLLFFLLFFIFVALGVELFGRLGKYQFLVIAIFLESLTLHLFHNFKNVATPINFVNISAKVSTRITPIKGFKVGKIGLK